MHLAAAIPNFLILDQMEEERSLQDQLCTNLARYDAGMFVLATERGLDTNLQLDLLAEYGFHAQLVAGSSESL